MALRLLGKRLVSATARPAVTKQMTASISFTAYRAARGGFNPFLHSQDDIDDKKVASTIDLGDGQTKDIPVRVKYQVAKKDEPPLKLSGPVGKISMTLYTFASQDGHLEAVEKDFATMDKTLFGTQLWNEWLKGAGAKTSAQMVILEDYMKTTTLSPFIKKLLPYFVEERMMKFLPEVSTNFAKLMKAKRGEVEVSITSAEPIDKATLAKLEKAIMKDMKVNKASFKTSVDESLVAGMRVLYGSTLIDTTVAGKITQIKEHMRKGLIEDLKA